MKSAFDDLIIKYANKYGLDSNLVRAICFVESSFNPDATRFEKDWKYFYETRFFAKQLEIPLITEEKNQATSWGLMQVMGSVARELGYHDNLEYLLSPELGIMYGCIKLKQISQRKSCDEETKVIASYNAGSPRKTKGGMFVNQRYVDKVSRQLIELRKLT